MGYLLLKWIHILSATILFGTGIGSAFYLFMGNRSRNTAAIAFVTRQVVMADWLFTTPAVIIQLLSGIALAHQLGLPLSESWLRWALIAYAFAILCWLPVVWIQIQMRNQAKSALESGHLLPASYWKLNRWWITLGTLAVPAMLAVFYLMVFKPV